MPWVLTGVKHVMLDGLSVHRHPAAMMTPDRVLSRPALLAARKNGSLFVEPFDQRYFKGCAVDVRLGDHYYAEQPATSSSWVSEADLASRNHQVFPNQESRLDGPTGTRWLGEPVLNPFDPKSVAAMWGAPQKAAPLTYDLPGIPKGTPVIVIPPGGVFLGHTMEFIGSLSPELTFMIKARSSTGRNRVRVASCAGWGDQGFAWRVTLELANDSQWRHIVLVPGRRIAQVVFIPTTPLPEDELYYLKGKYQQGSPASKSYDELVAAWSPSGMLPQQWKDFEVQQP